MNLREYSKNRPFELTGTIVLAAFPLSLLIFCWALGLHKGVIISGLLLIGQLGQWCIGIAAWHKAKPSTRHHPCDEGGTKNVAPFPKHHKGG